MVWHLTDEKTSSIKYDVHAHVCNKVNVEVNYIQENTPTPITSTLQKQIAQNNQKPKQE